MRKIACKRYKRGLWMYKNALQILVHFERLLHSHTRRCTASHPVQHLVNIMHKGIMHMGMPMHMHMDTNKHQPWPCTHRRYAKRHITTL